MGSKIKTKLGRLAYKKFITQVPIIPGEGGYRLSDF